MLGLSSSESIVQVAGAGKEFMPAAVSGAAAGAAD